jgi:hypothetical protein
MKHLLTFLVLFVAISSNFVQAQSCNILDFGAKPDENSINTKAIQQAIDACHRGGGGRVIVPRGVFYSGTLVLKSNVELHIEAGGVLKGSPHLEDYRYLDKILGLLYALDVENITLSGAGEINGNGTHFMHLDRIHNFVDYDTKYIRQGDDFMKKDVGIGDGPVAYTARPDMMIMIYHSSRVKIKDLRLLDTPSWTLRLSECEDVECSNLTVLTNLLIPNSDGIHITTSRNVLVNNCNVHAGDDALIVTGFGDETGQGGLPEGQKAHFGNHSMVAENIVACNCVLQSRSAGIRIGYGKNNIRNLLFSNISIFDSNRGIGIFCRDANRIEDISFFNINIQTRLHTGKWWGRAEPIHVSMGKNPGEDKLGVIRSVSFSQVKIPQAEAGIVIWGEEQSPIEDLSIADLQISLKSGPLAERYGGNFDLRPINDRAKALFKHDIPAIFATQVKNLRLEKIKARWLDTQPAPYFSNGLVVERFQGLTLDQIETPAANKSVPDIVLQNGQGLRQRDVLPGTLSLKTVTKAK